MKGTSCVNCNDVFFFLFLLFCLSSVGSKESASALLTGGEQQLGFGSPVSPIRFKNNCGHFVILKSHNSYSVSAFFVLLVPQKGLNVQIIVIILYKIW